jgi:hypothetical protein
MGKNSNDRWTDEEDKRLLELRTNGKSNVLIASALRRTLSSVAPRISVLKKRASNGAKISLPDRKKTQWGSADEARLVGLKPAGASISDMASELKRTEAAIENRLHRTPAT